MYFPRKRSAIKLSCGLTVRIGHRLTAARRRAGGPGVSGIPGGAVASPTLRQGRLPRQGVLSFARAGEGRG